MTRFSYTTSKSTAWPGRRSSIPSEHAPGQVLPFRRSGTRKVRFSQKNTVSSARFEDRLLDSSHTNQRRYLYNIILYGQHRS